MNIGLGYKDLSHSKKAIVHNKYSNSSPILLLPINHTADLIDYTAIKIEENKMENRIIHAFVYALSGAVLGLILIPVWGLFINIQTSPVSIVLASSLFFAIWGFLFPNSAKNVFMYLWNFLR